MERRLSRERGRFADAYILAFSSVPEVYAPDLLTSAGASDCVVKPIVSDVLKAALRRLGEPDG